MDVGVGMAGKVGRRKGARIELGGETGLKVRDGMKSGDGRRCKDESANWYRARGRNGRGIGEGGRGKDGSGSWED